MRVVCSLVVVELVVNVVDVKGINVNDKVMVSNFKLEKIIFDFN